MLDKIGKILYKYSIKYEKRNNYKGGINMANIEEVSGVFGGVTVNNEQNFHLPLCEIKMSGLFFPP